MGFDLLDAALKPNINWQHLCRYRSIPDSYGFHGSWPSLPVCTIRHRDMQADWPASVPWCITLEVANGFDGLRSLAPRSTVFPFRLA